MKKTNMDLKLIINYLEDNQIKTMTTKLEKARIKFMQETARAFAKATTRFESLEKRVKELESNDHEQQIRELKNIIYTLLEDPKSNIKL